MAAKVLKFPGGDGARRWQAADLTTLDAGWVSQAQRIDWEIRHALGPLIARSREAAQNDPHARAFLREVRVNVVGPQGIRLQSKARTRSGRPDKRLRDLIEERWARWGERGNCEVSGTFSWCGLQRQCIETVARDGAALYRKIPWDNETGFALQPIDILHLDHTFNESLGNGNTVVMGIEVDGWRRPVAYHLIPDDPSVYATHYRFGERLRVPAEQIIHVHLPEWVWQTRGVPWTATSLKYLHHAEGYEYAAVVAARAAASKMAYYKQSPEAEPTTDPATGELSGALGDGHTGDGRFVEEFEPGLFSVAPYGYTIESIDFNWPNADHESFIRPVHRTVAAGFGVNYNKLSQDWTGVNLSSMRHAAQVEREHWMEIQAWLIESLCQQVFRPWADAEMQQRLIPMPANWDDAARRREVHRVQWQARRWQMVDPDKEMKSREAALRMRTRSITDFIVDDGRDPDEVWEQLEQDVARLREMGLEPSEALGLMAAQRPAAAAPEPPGEPEEETDDD